jgi:AcrR family transcriptional regulator
MPRDSAPARSAILAAALQTLRREGLEGFSIATIAQRAGVAKGLVLYHYGSRQRLLSRCAAEIESARADGLAAALGRGSGGAAAADACWTELCRQTEDGTARAWLALCAADVIDRSDKNEDFEGAVRSLLLDGCTAALATGRPLRDVRDAFDAGWLALLEASGEGMV